MTLAERIEDHRHLYRVEIDFSPSQRTPPVAYKWDRSQRAMVPDDSPLVINPLTADEIQVPDSATQSTQVGVPMSGRMYRYLVGPTAETPWAFAWKALRGHCRRSHRYHMTPPHWRGALCWQLVNLVIVQGFSVHNAARITQYDDPEPLLREAFDFIEGEIDKQRAKQEQRAREDAGKFTIYDEAPRHHAVPGLHQQDCPQCRRNAA